MLDDIRLNMNNKKNDMLSIDIYLKDRAIKTDSFQMNLNI